MKKNIKVVGAIIENERHEILCALRSPDMTIPNHWEFPGGKLEDGETLQQAICRELQEELNCTVEVINVFHNNSYEYEKFVVNLITVRCRIVGGTPVAQEHAKLLWLQREALLSLVWAPADIPSAKLLAQERLPQNERTKIDQTTETLKE